MRTEQTAWTLHVHPKDDELLSSWLARNARVQLTKVHTFCSSNWPSIEVWNRDIDRFPHPLLVQMLAHKTGTPLTVAQNTTLKSFVRKLYDEDPVTHNNFILPLGIWHRKRKLNGLLFCPRCLSLDGNQPYYRKKWRLSMSFICSSCGVHLLDTCPSCKSPVAFFRNDFISKTDIPRSNLDACSNCGMSLALAPCTFASNEEVELQLKLENYVKVGVRKFQPSMFFDVILHMAWVLSSRNRRLSSLQNKVSEINPIKKGFRPFLTFRKSNLFSLRDLEERKILFQIASWLLCDFPERIASLMKESGTSYKAIIGEKKNLPRWFKKGCYLL